MCWSHAKVAQIQLLLCRKHKARKLSMNSSAETSRSHLVTRLRKFLTTPIAETSRSQRTFWFSLSLTCAAMYGLMGLRMAFSSEYVVQDDAQQHVFWMRRFLDPELFPNDLIANYYESVAQPGYKAIYQLMAALGVDPIVLSKLLPMVLGLILTAYCFGICLQVLPVPATGFLSTLLLNQVIWQKDDLVSGTARSFMYPLFLAFLYYLLRRSLLPCLAAIALQGLFYPSTTLLSAGILVVRLWRWERGKLRLSQERSDYLFCAAGLGVAFLVLLPLALESSEFSPATPAAEARTMIEFSDAGRSRFFLNSPIEFWLYADRSGVLPVEWSRFPYFYFLVMLCVALLLPRLLHSPSQFPLVRQITSNITLFPQILLASLGLFLAAHALLFKLYLPSRYSQYSVRILTPLAAAIALTIILDGIFHAWGQGAKFRLFGKPVSSVAVTALLGVALLSYPLFLSLNGFRFPSTDTYVVGEVPELYEFFLQQPKDSLIASLTALADELPSFAQRSILVSREHSIPYHKGYYTQIRQRTMDLIKAQYSPNLNEVQRFIQKYGVDFWLVDRAQLFTPSVDPGHIKFFSHTNFWLKQFPQTAEARVQLKQGKIPAVVSLINRCSAFQTQNLVVLEASCILEMPGE